MIFEQLAIAYAQSWRHYHTQIHIEDCLNKFSKIHAIAPYPNEIELALWFHDAVYAPKRHDNEDRSAQWAEHYLHSVGAKPASITRIVELILATKLHEASDLSTALLLDIDLSILGASPKTFQTYDAAIRREYRWVPKAQYIKTRSRILQSFLERPSIYRTSHFQNQYEAQAHLNLQAQLKRLKNA